MIEIRIYAQAECRECGWKSDMTEDWKVNAYIQDHLAEGHPELRP